MMGVPTFAGAVAVCLFAAYLSAQQPATSQPTAPADEIRDELFRR